jgi:UDP-N-acetylmuramyl pentapeptide phosphotransferase/UDP-N-acetylglucosamine-1-phosphate transferase
VDNPGGRKIHDSDTSALGGIPIVIGIMISLMVWLPIGLIAQFKFLLLT